MAETQAYSMHRLSFELLLDDKHYRQALPTPRASCRLVADIYFYTRLHKISLYNFSLCFWPISYSEATRSMIPGGTSMFQPGCGCSIILVFSHSVKGEERGRRAERQSGKMRIMNLLRFPTSLPSHYTRGRPLLLIPYI